MWNVQGWSCPPRALVAQHSIVPAHDDDNFDEDDDDNVYDDDNGDDNVDDNCEDSGDGAVMMIMMMMMITMVMMMTTVMAMMMTIVTMLNMTHRNRVHGRASIWVATYFHFGWIWTNYLETKPHISHFKHILKQKN